MNSTAYQKRKPLNFDKKLQHSIELLQKSEKLALRYSDKGFYLAFSGGKDKIVINPIIDWTREDVWYFLNEVVKVEHCELYDKGWQRIGCLFCPMASQKEIIKQGGHIHATRL